MSSFVVSVLHALPYLILKLTHWGRHNEFCLHVRKLGLQWEDDLTQGMELEEATEPRSNRAKTHVFPTTKLSQFPSKSYQTV